MYLPEHFKSEDWDQMVTLIEDFSFGLLISIVENNLEISHIPFRIACRKPLVLEGHVAVANPVSKQVFAGKRFTAVFSAEHAYISPTWYHTPGFVPTWNYVAVHVAGEVKPIIDKSNLALLVEELADQFERDREDPWVPDYSHEMLTQIVGFRMYVDRVDGKFKLSQNRSKNDREGLIRGLEDGSVADIALAKRMRECT